MMRALILSLLLVTRVWALDTSTEGFFPSWGGVGGGPYGAAISSSANALRCWTLPARIGFTSITKIAIAYLSNGGGGCLGGTAIYDVTGATPLAAISVSCATAGVKTATVAPFSLVQNTLYRLCTCTTAGSVNMLSLFEAQTNSTLRSKVAERNIVSITQGIAANPCVLGVTPATTGALSPAQTFSPPMLRLEQ